MLEAAERFVLTRPPGARSLLSKFSVTTDGMHALKVRSARMQAPKEITVKACRPDSDKPVVRPPLTLPSLPRSSPF